MPTLLTAPLPASADTPHRFALAPPLSWWLIPILLSWCCVGFSIGAMILGIGALNIDSPSQLAGLAEMTMAGLATLVLSVIGIILGWIGSIGDPRHGGWASRINAYIALVPLALFILSILGR